MKKALFLITFIALTFVSNTTAAPAQAQGGYIWTCYARSPVAIGVWRHPNQSFAADRAVEECQARTPPNMFCTFSGCE